MQNSTDGKRWILQRWPIVVPGLLLLVFLVVWWARPAPLLNSATFAVRRGPLQISILEGGSIESRQAQEVRSEIKGYQGTKILSIVEEGYLVTEEDVKNGKVLVELDSSDLKQRITTQDIQFQSTLASLTEARQAFEIQVNQNKTDIKAAEQKARFAWMDLEKYLGDKVTLEVLTQLGLPVEKPTSVPNQAQIDSSTLVQLAAVSTARTAALSEMRGPGSGTNLVSVEIAHTDPPGPTVRLPAGSAVRPSVAVDFTKYAKAELLGDGAAKQQLRKLEDELLVAQSEKALAKSKLDGTTRLQQKDFVTKTELENEKLTYDKSALKVQTAETALALFIKYEFTKAAEEALGKYEEALQSLERARKEAVSKLAQSEAKLRSAEGRFRIEETQQKELYEQLEKCVIRAQKPGLVIYGGGGDRRFYSNEDQIREGATIRERQPIITIPDMSQMSVKVKIHEAHIKKVKRGMKCRVHVDAFPDELLEGEVAKVGVLPDSQDRWMNPDLKVYLTTIHIDGAHDWVKPGMSARVEVQVRELPDVIYIPLQAVAPEEGKHFCHVVNGSEVERREVQVGDFNDEFIEIKSGLKENERVLLQAPAVAAPEETGEEEADAEKKPSESAVTPAPATASGPASSGSGKPAAPAGR